MEELISFFKERWKAITIFSLIIAGSLYSLDNFMHTAYFIKIKQYFPFIILIITFLSLFLSYVDRVKKFFSCFPFLQKLYCILLSITLGLALYCLMSNFLTLLTFTILFILLSLFELLKKINLNNGKKNKTSLDILYGNCPLSDEPITSISKDHFNRGKFIKNFSDLIISSKSDGIVYGLNGKWGSGKTSFVLMALNAHKNKIDKIHFESWHYRDPNKITEKLFNEIAEILMKNSKNKWKIRITLRALSNYVKSFSFYGLTINIPESIYKDPKQTISDILRGEYKSRLVIFIDDLDRLDKFELTAIFRSIRLLNGLPKIQFVLAYDKSNIKNLLYPNDDNLDQAADYLGKIIQCEFTLALPPENIRINFLEKIVSTSGINKPLSDEFFEFIKNERLSFHLFRLLDTPRTIKTILSQTIWIYTNTKNDNQNRYNFNDLFILTTLQYCLPDLYERLYTENASVTEFLLKKFKLPPRSFPAFLENCPLKDEEYRERILDKLDNKDQASVILLQYILPPIIWY